MNNKPEVWVEIEEYPHGDENIEAEYPFNIDGVSLYELEERLQILRATHYEYLDLRFVYHWKSHGYGAISKWWVLEGRTK